MTHKELHQLTTPRAAAIAGVAFALLFGTAVLLMRIGMPEGTAGLDVWLRDERDSIRAATVLMPFAGIAFLWFVGAVRDSFGSYEDRFFATVFLGSGMLFLAMTFVAAAVAAALVGADQDLSHAGVTDFGTRVFLVTSQTYGVRMAAVFMMSLATIWRKTGLMPGWLVGVSYVVALGLLAASDVSVWVTLGFPAWVLAVSSLILLRAGVFDSHRVSNTS